MHSFMKNSKHEIQVYNLVNKAIMLSHGDFHKNNIKTVKNILKNNHYPSKFVNKHVNIRLNKLTHPDRVKIKNWHENLNPSIVLPHHNVRLSHSLERYLRYHKIRTIYKVVNKLDWVVKKAKD